MKTKTLEQVTEYIKENPAYVTNLIQDILINSCCNNCNECQYQDVCAH